MTAAAMPLPKKKQFGTILIDPPWRFQNRTGKIAPEHKRLHRYGTMSFEEIAQLPVGELGAPKSHLYLWTPNALLPEAINVFFGVNMPSSYHRRELEDARHLACPLEIFLTQCGADLVQFLGIFQRQIRSPSFLRFDQLDIDFGSVLPLMYELGTASMGHDFSPTREIWRY